MAPRFSKTVKPLLIDLNVRMDERLFKDMEAALFALGMSRRAFVEMAVNEALEKNRKVCVGCKNKNGCQHGCSESPCPCEQCASDRASMLGI
jgi:hypothetical protein